MHLRFLSVFALLAVFGGCSIINKFDDVKQQPGTGGAGGSGGSAGAATGGGAGVDGSAGSAGSTGGSAGASGSAGAAGTSGASGTGGTAGTSGAGGAAGSDAGPPLNDGLIVMAAEQTANASKFELDVLDPWTGKVLGTQEQTHVQAIAYDSLYDRWYIFKQGATAVDPATLSVRTYNRATTKWTELGSATVPAVTSQSMLAVLKDRILYQSTVKPTSGAPTQGLSILDVSNLANIVVLGNPPQSALPDGAKALIARPNSSGPGGSATLVSVPSTSCGPLDPDAGTSPTVCNVHVITVTVTSGSSVPSLEGGGAGGKDVGQIPQTNSGVGVTSDPTPGGNSDIVVLPPVDYTTQPTGFVKVINPTNHNITGTFPFTVNGSRISDAAFDPCNQVVITGELLKDQSVFVVPTTTGGTVQTISSSTAVQALVFEPFTRSVLRLFDDSANPEITAYLLGGTKTAPALSLRLTGSTPPWSPPTGLRPKVLVVKQPATPSCP